MPDKKATGSGKSRRPTKKGEDSSPPSRKKQTSKKSEETLDPSAQRFVRDLLIRGEAAKPTADGELPPGATHKIVDDDKDGLPTVERERFSIY